MSKTSLQDDPPAPTQPSLRLINLCLTVTQASTSLLFLFLVLSSCQPKDNKNSVVDIDDETYRVKWMSTEPIDDNWKEHWVVEGDSIAVGVKENKLLIDDYTGATLWNVHEFPKNLIVSFKVRALERDGNKTNFNLITHASETNGSELVIGKESGRIGRYKSYHVFPNYINTFVYKHSRLRKNPGFDLLHETQDSSEVNTTYEIVFTAYDGHLQYFINGEKIHEMQDDSPLTGGKVGLRTWNTLAHWYDIKIGEIVSQTKTNAVSEK